MCVVHCLKKTYDVYIGRGKCPRTGKQGEFGNPFSIGKHGNRQDVIRKYEEWVRSNPKMMERIKNELKDKVLGCWCSPEACHGDVLIRIAND